MVKIDVSKIEGYAEMTAEQKLAVLESYEYNDYSGEVERYKNAASKANSEAAEWKKKHNELLSEEDKKKLETQEKMARIEAELETLRKEKVISSNTASLIALGYDETLATETATAMLDGDTAKIFANQKKFLELKEKKIRTELLRETPNPPPGGGSNTLTKEKFKKLGLIEKQEIATKNPELYKKLTEE